MIRILPDLLRSFVSMTMLLVLLCSLARPKYGRWHWSLLLIAAAAVLTMNAHYYLSGNYNAMVYSTLFLLVPVLFTIRLFFESSFLEWTFNVLTSLNVYCVAFFLSYRISRVLPYPRYADVALLALLMGGACMLFRRGLQPVYEMAVEHWQIYILPALSIFSCFVYLYVFSGDIEQLLDSHAAMLFLLSITAVCMYATIFWSLQKSQEEHAASEAALRAEERQVMLQAELSAYDEYVVSARRSRHDLRHHDAVVMEYLQNGDTAGALRYLHGHDEILKQSQLQEYCRNKTANAVLRLYERRAAAEGISFSVQAVIPERLKMKDPEFGGLLSNLLENAMESCRRCGSVGTRISLKAAADDDRLCLELCNTAPADTKFRDGLPVSRKPGGGTGLRSVNAALAACGGLSEYSLRELEFHTRIIIPC